MKGIVSFVIFATKALFLSFFVIGSRLIGKPSRIAVACVLTINIENLYDLILNKIFVIETMIRGLTTIKFLTSF